MSSNGWKSKSRKHVADKFYEYAQKGLSSTAVETKVDTMPALSLYMFVTSLLALGGRVRRLGQLELGIAEFMSWQRPAMTLSILMAYSTLCYRPQWLVLLPLFLFITNVLIPNYAVKFRLKNSDHLDGEFVQLNVKSTQEADDEKKQTRTLLEVVRKGQHSLSHIVDALDKVDQFRAGPAKFVDPKPSCLMLVATTLLLIISAVGLTFVSVPAFFSVIGWVVVLSKHPMVRLAKKNLESVKFQSTLDVHEAVGTLDQLARRHVIIDDVPLKRTVEAFELQPQGLTPRQWNSLRAVYSSSMYTPDTKYRLEKQLAPSVSQLADILPPEGWHFDSSVPWTLDSDAASWTFERQVSHVEVDGPWATDTDTDSLSDTWRRRRWTRCCFYKF